MRYQLLAGVVVGAHAVASFLVAALATRSRISCTAVDSIPNGKVRRNFSTVTTVARIQIPVQPIGPLLGPTRLAQ